MLPVVLSLIGPAPYAELGERVKENKRIGEDNENPASNNNNNKAEVAGTDVMLDEDASGIPS